MLQKIKEHPVVAGIAAVIGAILAGLGLLAAAWQSVDVDSAAIPTLWGFVKPMLSVHSALVLLCLTVLTAAVVVVGVIVSSAVQNKREVSRLERDASERRSLVVFAHLKGDADLAKRIHALFQQGGWDVTLTVSHVPHHDKGVRVIGGWQMERTIVAWGLSTLGISAEMDPSDAPMLQVVVGAAQPMTIETVKQELETATTERDQARVDLKDKKHEYAMEVLERYSKITFKDPQPTVTVKYASYGKDYELAQQIQGLFTQYVKWPVELEATYKPALPRADEYKVIFDVGMTYFTYGPLIHAISEGDLLGEEVAIGKRQFVEREDSHHLIVMVLPSVGAEPIKADPA